MVQIGYRCEYCHKWHTTEHSAQQCESHCYDLTPNQRINYVLVEIPADHLDNLEWMAKMDGHASLAYAMFVWAYAHYLYDGAGI